MKITVRYTMIGLIAALLSAISISAQVLTPLYTFDNTNEVKPAQVGLLLSDNTFYGVNGDGIGGSGSKSVTAVTGGALFKLNDDGTGFTNFYIFSPVTRDITTNGDGSEPTAPMALSGNRLYGTATEGGLYGDGTVFAINTDGTGFTNLHNFHSTTTGGGGFLTNSDGVGPSAGLVLSGDLLYGTTTSGGVFGGGIIFSIHTDGGGFTNLYSFSAFTNSSDTNGDGAGVKSLVLSGNTLYGTATRGGAAGNGTVFSINTDGTSFTNLHNFAAIGRMTTPPYLYTNTDGIIPVGGLVLSGNTLYGTTMQGGTNTNNLSNAGGTIFAINTDGGNFTTLRHFGANDGNNPAAGLVLSGDTLYGARRSAGGLNEGTVFAMKTDGSGFTTLDDFTPLVFNSISGGYTNAGGAIPVGNLVLSGSILYGAAEEGGTNGDGMIYALNLAAEQPSIQFTATPTNGLTRLTVQFTAPAVDTEGNPILTWTWNFGDGSSSTVQNPPHTYTNAATFLPTLTCINSYGNTVNSSGPAITVEPLPPIQFTATPTNGMSPSVVVKFTSPSADAGSNMFVFWNWNFGDGSSSTAQNPSHTYTNAGTFSPTLTCTNFHGDSVVGFGPDIVVLPNLIINGDFETGTFTNWTRSGNTNSPRGVTTGSTIAHSGKYGAELMAPGTAGALGYLSQPVSTLSGGLYLISFWLNTSRIGTPNDFQVSWNGDVVLDMANIADIGWTNVQLTVNATSTNSTLQFGYVTGTFFFGLDDIGVASLASGGGSLPQSPTLSSIAVSGANLVLNGASGHSSQTYYALMSTNLAAPLRQWTPVATNVLGDDGNFSIILTNAVTPGAPPRFYILQSP